MAEMSNVPDCAGCDCAATIPCDDCDLPAADLDFTVDNSFYGDPGPPAMVTAHYRAARLDLIGGGAGLGAEPPYWYTDPHLAYDGRWYRYVYFCSLSDGFRMWEVSWATEAEADAGLVLIEDLATPDYLAGDFAILPIGGPCVTTQSCDPLLVEFQTSDIDDGYEGVKVAISQGTPVYPPFSVAVVVTVKDFDCVSGNTLPSIPVDLLMGDDPTPIESGTTDGSGVFSFAPVTEGGLYRVRGTLGDCVKTVDVPLSTCDGASPHPVVLELCCKTACVVAQDDETDGPISGADAYLPSGAHALVGGTPVVTDVDGRACFPLSDEEYDALTLSGDGCRRQVLVTIVKALYLTRCEPAVVSCVADPADQPIRLSPTTGLVDSENLCADDGCAVPGVRRRGQLRENLTLNLLQLEAQDAGGAWIDIRGTDTVFALTLDANILAGAATPTGSPFFVAYGADPAIEYYGVGLSGWTAPASVVNGGGTCTDAFDVPKVWVRSGAGRGAWFRREGTGFGSSTTVPPGNIECAESVSYIEFPLVEDIDLCLSGPDPDDALDITYSGSATQANGRGIRWTVNIQE